MIAPLRARHRATFAVLALALPTAFAFALLGRDDERRAAELPQVLNEDGPQLGEARWTRSLHHDGRVFTLRFGANASVVGVAQESGERAPDVLAYWSAATDVTDELPADARLLGAVGLRERRFELAASRSGSIVLFSVARGEVLGSIALAAEPR